MCRASRTACGSPSSTLSWQGLWWSLIAHSDSQGAEQPTMRVESVETSPTNPNWALLSSFFPANGCIRYSWNKAFRMECVYCSVLPVEEISSFWQRSLVDLTLVGIVLRVIGCVFLRISCELRPQGRQRGPWLEPWPEGFSPGTLASKCECD